MAKVATTLEDTKLRLREAYRAAKRSDKLSGALYDRWMSEALALSRGQPTDRATVMLHRTAIMLEIAAETRGSAVHPPGLSGRFRSLHGLVCRPRGARAPCPS
jgi:hypothetical protein